MFPLFFMKTVKNMTEQNERFSPQTIDVKVLGGDMKTPGSGLRWFLPILRKGFGARGKNGASIRDFFCRDMGGEPDYLDQRIQTILLNGKPVDDVDSTRIHDGVVLAFSSAMPGVAGATLRKGGKYAPMRAAISCHDNDAQVGGEYVYATLKLFNMVAEELGAFFLEKGIFVTGSDIRDLFAGCVQDAASQDMEIRWDGQKIGSTQLAKARGMGSRILLKVAP